MTPPRAEPQPWHRNSVAAWDRFGEGIEQSRRDLKKMREAQEKRRAK